MTADSSRFAALVDAHRGLVRGLCRRLDPEPEDCAQEVWEKVIASQGRFDPAKGSLRTWIATLTRRHIVDRHRRRAVREAALDPPAPPRPDPDRVLDLERALQRLPLAQRRAVVFHHHQGVSLEELAELEGVPVGTIKSRLHRGRAALVELLESTHDR